MNITDKFQEAKQIAINIELGCMRFVKDSNFAGYKHNDDRMFVLSTDTNDIQNPDMTIKMMDTIFVAREVFGDFTVMYKR